MIYILSNILLIDNLPFGDDFIFIFGQSEIKNAPNPFLFFFPWSDYFKSWGLSYFVFWNLYKVFGENFVYYRLINIIFHILNSLTLYKIVKTDKKESLAPKIIFLLFLFSPLSILTTSWIFQLKTTLSTFLVLLFIKNIFIKKMLSIKSLLKGYVIFLMSLLAKISGVLIPALIILKWKDINTSNIKKWLILPLFITTSIFYGLINVKGITHLANELIHIEKKSIEAVDQKVYSRSQAIEIKQKNTDQQKIINFDIDITNELVNSSQKYFNSNYNLSRKYTIALQNFGKLVLYTVGLNDYYPFYESNIKTLNSSSLYLFSLVGLLSIIYLWHKSKTDLFLIMILFIPISGLFYIPYMKFSYASDHWFYLPSIGILIFISKFYKKRLFLYILLAITIFQYTYTQYKYQSYKKVLSLNNKKFGNKIISEHQIQYDLLEGKTSNALKKYIKLYENQPASNYKYIKNIINLAVKTNNIKVLNKYYHSGAKYYLKTQDIKVIESYNLNHLFIKNKKQIELIESLNAIFTKKIDSTLYEKTITRLK